jgi:glycerol-3-phosphate dehydrogenase subunit B
MPRSNSLKAEITVIGTGMAGMAAALFAVKNGLSTAIVGSSAEIIFASGFLDLLGVHPIEEKRIWNDPWAGIAALAGDNPNHPYARLPRERIRDSLDDFIGFLEKAGLSYRRRLKRNVMAISPMGTVKPTYAIPRSMWNGVIAFEKKTPCLIVGLDGLKGFSARLIAETLGSVWPTLKPVQISYPEINHQGELYPERVAHDLEFADNREKLAQCIRPHLKKVQAVGMPAIFGLYHPEIVYDDLEKRLGLPLFELPTMPPSIPGLRIKGAFEQRLPEMGVQTFFQKKVLSARHEPDQGFVLNIGQSTTEQTLRTGAVILASGRFLGRGLHAERTGIRETVFDLPVYQPGERAGWHRNEFLDPQGHPINRAGLEIDANFRPLGKGGGAAYPTLFAAGSILAHQDWMRQKCGSGLAVASAHAAVTFYMKLAK